MDSAKPTMILKSKTDLTDAEIAALTDSEAWSIIYTTRKPKAKKKLWRVCFTGFCTSDKQRLTKVAEDNHFKVMTSVTAHLDYLVFGENAGPRKMEAAIANGVTLLGEAQFMDLIETNELLETETWTAYLQEQENKLQVYFTGFDFDEKDQLLDLAEENDFKVVSSVTKKLDFLVCGEHPGQKKIETALSQGVQILNEQQFINLIKTGDLPEKEAVINDDNLETISEPKDNEPIS